MRILITGGAGFVGSSLARLFHEKDSKTEVVTFDNLRRRGSEFNLKDFKKLGIKFVHGDVRNPSDLEDIGGSFDLMIEASAEPSVLAGTSGTPNYVLQTNLTGTQNCLEYARKKVGTTVFLSTSRVYSIEPLRSLLTSEGSSRFEMTDKQISPGASAAGISEAFPTHLARSFYGATKLASEMLIQEYAFNYQMKAVINRCGVIAGPGQFGKVDQGVFTLWVMHHYFQKPLKYTGFGGTGKQVRDLLHPRDLFAAISTEIGNSKLLNGDVYNLGGGRAISTSLLEYTSLCSEITGKKTPIASDSNSASVDIPIYLSDYGKAERTFGWKPQITPRQIVSETQDWIRKNETELAFLL